MLNEKHLAFIKNEAVKTSFDYRKPLTDNHICTAEKVRTGLASPKLKNVIHKLRSDMKLRTSRLLTQHSHKEKLLLMTT